MSNKRAGPKKVVRATQPPEAQMDNLELKIVITPEGRVHVEGPLHDSLLTYGLLKLGEKQIDRYYEQKRKERDESRIHVPSGPLGARGNN